MSESKLKYDVSPIAEMTGGIILANFKKPERTVEEYQTPNRNRINKIGIEPNETVELPSDVESVLNVPEDKDTQLQKAQEIANKNQ